MVDTILYNLKTIKNESPTLLIKTCWQTRFLILHVVYNFPALKFTTSTRNEF